MARRGPSRRAVLGLAAALPLATPPVPARAAVSGIAALPGWRPAAFDRAAALGHLPPFDAGLSGPAFTAGWAARPVGDTHITAYYEPVIEARRTRSAAFPIPVLAPPAGDGPWPARGAIMTGALEGRARPLYWLRDAVTLYYLQIQGSGRLELEDGTLVRLGYAGRNGHPYASIGRIMRDEGLMAEVDGRGVRGWLRDDPVRGAAMMARNPSYIFFAERSGLAPEDGPVGAMGLPLPAGHAVAIDPDHHPFGTLFWLRFDHPDGRAIARLVMAMDRGAAIKGAARVDLFTGTGDAAWEEAQAINTTGRLWRLAPAASP